MIRKKIIWQNYDVNMPNSLIFQKTKYIRNHVAEGTLAGEYQWQLDKAYKSKQLLLFVTTYSNNTYQNEQSHYVL